MLIYSHKEYIRIIRPLPSYVERDLFSIPVIQPDKIDIHNLLNGRWLINIKNATVKDTYANQKIVHAFCYDDELRRLYNNPYKLLEKVSNYYAATTLDFSMHEQMDKATIINAVYSNRWIGAFLQCHGIKVCPTVGWVNPDTYDICFSGLRDYSTFLISTLSVNNETCKATFLNGYYELRKRFPNSQLICVGNKIDGMDNDICFVPYRKSFGNENFYKEYWQPSLINWDGSLNEEVL